MERAFLIISILTVFFFFIISIVRIILYCTFRYIINKYKRLLSFLKFKKDKKSNSSTNSNREDQRLRDKEKEKKLDKVYKINQEEQILQQPTQTRIVGIVKPVGKWTQLILGQKVSYMMQQANALKQQTENGYTGYWQTMEHSHDTRRRNRGASR